MTRHEFESLLKDASPTVVSNARKALMGHDNHTPAKIQDSELPQCTPQLAVGSSGEAPGSKIPVVRYTLRRVRLLDVDARYASCKDTLDGLQYAGLIHSDKEGALDLIVRQEKVRSYAEEETIIEVILP